LSLFSSNAKLVLLHKGLKALPKASKYDFVLSPQFYISKREKLPIKYAFQAKKLAPSILEDILPTDYPYEYLVKKEGDSWIFFAYSPKEIEEFLKSCCNVSPNKIGKIYFADQLRGVLKKVPLGVDEDSAITLIDGKATMVPRSMIDSKKYAKFSKKLRPQKGFSFKNSSRASKDGTLDNRVVALGIVLLLLAAAFVIDGLNYKVELKKQEAKLNQIFEEYPQLQSKLTRDSIKNKYINIDKKERKIRDLIDTLSQLTSKKSLLDKLELDKNRLIAQFSVDSKDIKKIEKIAKDANLKVSRLSNSLIRVEGAIK